MYVRLDIQAAAQQGSVFVFLLTEIVNHLWTRTGKKGDVSALTLILSVRGIQDFSAKPAETHMLSAS